MIVSAEFGSKQSHEIGPRFLGPGPNFIELLKQLLVLKGKDTSHRYMCNDILAGYLILVSIILLCLATFCA